MATNPPNDPAQPPVPPVPVVPRPTTAPPEPVSTVPVAPTPPPPTVPVNPTPAVPAPPAPPAPPTPPVVSTRDTSLVDEAQARALAQPKETIPTREEWAAAGYPPEKYDERFGANAVPTPREQNYFCLEAAHPGGASGRADTFDVSRHFSFTGHGAPTCPLCKRAVTALLVADNTKLPPSIQTVKDRLEVAERAAR